MCLVQMDFAEEQFLNRTDVQLTLNLTFLIIVCVGLFLSSLILFLLRKKINSSFVNVFIFTLALFELILCIFQLMIGPLNVLFDFPNLTDFNCKLFAYMLSLSVYVKVLISSTLFIGLAKFKEMKPKTALKVIAIILLSGLIIKFPEISHTSSFQGECLLWPKTGWLKYYTTINLVIEALAYGIAELACVLEYKTLKRSFERISKNVPEILTVFVIFWISTVVTRNEHSIYISSFSFFYHSAVQIMLSICMYLYLVIEPVLFLIYYEDLLSELKNLLSGRKRSSDQPCTVYNNENVKM